VSTAGFRGAAQSASARREAMIHAFEALDFVENPIRKNGAAGRKNGADFLHVSQFLRPLRSTRFFLRKFEVDRIVELCDPPGCPVSPESLQGW
jgi:hypothetical protein